MRALRCFPSLLEGDAVALRNKSAQIFGFIGGELVDLKIIQLQQLAIVLSRGRNEDIIEKFRIFPASPMPLRITNRFLYRLPVSR